MKRRIELPFMSVGGVAKHLGITPATVIMLAKKGDLPEFVLIGNRKMFQTDEIEQWKRRNHV